MKELTSRQQEVLRFITSFTEENSCPPTVRETGMHFCISVKAVQDHFAALRKKGYLAPAVRRSRSLKILIDDTDNQMRRSECIPVLGSVAAGHPIFCDENYSGSVYIPGSMVQKDQQYFAVYVRGDSMIDAGILEGDLAVIRQQEHARNGSIVVALIDEDVTLKRFFKEAERIRLQPENPKYNPLYCTNIKILGVLSNIIRNYR
ncbi:transcriptional repressor LexA [Treponema lecithinolyticum]|uniref:transcriptional repressor LexA n=1 Tax=Treponema lecithinolyticum TaxID=53418 RepID=UPI0028EF6F94|nr:transcriptional repressor LexA [Treponema lecithinolyticum]